jgi:hypothetical protein
MSPTQQRYVPSRVRSGIPNWKLFPTAFHHTSAIMVLNHLALPGCGFLGRRNSNIAPHRKRH